MDPRGSSWRQGPYLVGGWDPIGLVGLGSVCSVTLALRCGNRIFVGPFAGLATLSSGVALRVAVLFVLVGKTGLLTPTGVLSECSLLMGRVGVVALRGKEKHIISSLDLSCYNVQV